MLTNDYECVKRILTKTGYENDIEIHDEEKYLVLSTYANKVAIEFDRSTGEFARITEAD